MDVRVRRAVAGKTATPGDAGRRCQAEIPDTDENRLGRYGRQSQNTHRRRNVGDRRCGSRGRGRRVRRERSDGSHPVAARRPERRASRRRAASAVRCRRVIRGGGVVAHRLGGEQPASHGGHARRWVWPYHRRRDRQLPRRRFWHGDPRPPHQVDRPRSGHRLRVRRRARRRQSRIGHHAHRAARPRGRAFHQLRRPVHPDAGCDGREGVR